MKMARPDELPRWADGVDALITEPSEGKKTIGWDAGERPPAQFFNWLLNRIYQWLVYADQVIPPIGSIIFWHKSLTGIPGTLPLGWVECNGQTISDSESPINGQVIPNINGDGRFIRGSEISGTTQVSQNKSQTLTGNGTLDINVKNDGGNAISPLVNLGGSSYGQLSASGPWGIDAAKISSNDIAAKLSLAAGSPDESRPINISMVAIMRIK
jgi:hypothetical protein